MLALENEFSVFGSVMLHKKMIASFPHYEWVSVAIF